MDFMDLDPTTISSGSQALGQLKNTVTTIMDRVKVAKDKADKDEAIKELNGIISELIDEKQELIQTIQVFQEELIMKKISDDDVEYITSKIIPLIEDFIESSNDPNIYSLKENIEIFKPILSKETFKIMQLLGFNFKKAIGEPLTNLVEGAISSNTPLSQESQIDLQLAKEKKETEIFKVLQNKESYDRYIDFLERINN